MIAPAEAAELRLGQAEHGEEAGPAGRFAQHELAAAGVGLARDQRARVGEHGMRDGEGFGGDDDAGPAQRLRRGDLDEGLEQGARALVELDAGGGGEGEVADVDLVIEVEIVLEAVEAGEAVEIAGGGLADEAGEVVDVAAGHAALRAGCDGRSVRRARGRVDKSGADGGKRLAGLEDLAGVE